MSKHQEDEIREDEASENPIKLTGVSHSLNDHNYILPRDFEGYHMLHDQVKMKHQDCGKQEVHKVRSILGEIISIDYLTRSKPVVVLADANQDID